MQTVVPNQEKTKAVQSLEKVQQLEENEEKRGTCSSNPARSNARTSV